MIELRPLRRHVAVNEERHFGRAASHAPGAAPPELATRAVLREALWLAPPERHPAAARRRSAA